MSKCGRTHLLEAMTAGEVPPALETELRSHAVRCARCQHELNWLDSEQRLFRQRSGRDEVQRLWLGVEQRSEGLRARGVNRMLLALAAALVLVIGAGRLTATSMPQPLNADGSPPMVQGDELLQSSLSESAGVSADDAPACSRLAPGMGFFCGSAKSDVLASR